MLIAAFALLFGDILVSAFTTDVPLSLTTRTSSSGLHFPLSSYQTFDDGIRPPLLRRDASWAETASLFVASHLKINASTVKFHSGYPGELAEYAYIKQHHNNISFVNAVANVAFKNGKVVAFGHSFVKPTTIAPSTPTIPIETAISAAEKALNGTYNKHPTLLEYLVQPDSSVTLIYVIQVRNREQNTWSEAFVDAHSGKFLSSINLVSSAAYLALPVFKQDPREGFDFLVNPQNSASSPLGWHNDGTRASTDTSGNNALVYFNFNPTATTAQSGLDLIFNYTQNPNISPKERVNLDAARTNAFYTVNTLHDITIKYGFTAAAFNFQQVNFLPAGKAGDRVLVSVQNSEEPDNAHFLTPPDGQSGEMALGLWGYGNLYRDSALANDVIIHEFTHGITNRMTGGGTARCLQGDESAGLGEGWSDAMADWAEQVAAPIVDFTIGSYVNGGRPIRSNPYSTSLKVNPLKYSDYLQAEHVHAIGEIWANILHNVHAALVDAGGFSQTARTDPSGSAGNVVFLHLFIDGLALQPCEPTFIFGAHKCLLWKVFASRGLGSEATDFRDSYELPTDCKF
ncbi:Fungalysin metallopeptidase-domain-containing protein [Mycena rosella]|uniref:Extracellular metalloproteinase n=1 Tax=Mycena rosella TaxID=1033263 RepID=A0AAD7DAD3_MYCRO|nr:Fungalysin metallopeptidase-domain-containing protein [Mycena rosella]